VTIAAGIAVPRIVMLVIDEALTTRTTAIAPPIGFTPHAGWQLGERGTRH
jgi:hypothetical protein